MSSARLQGLHFSLAWEARIQPGHKIASLHFFGRTQNCYGLPIMVTQGIKWFCLLNWFIFKLRLSMRRQKAPLNGLHQYERWNLFIFRVRKTSAARQQCRNLESGMQIRKVFACWPADSDSFSDLSQFVLKVVSLRQSLDNFVNVVTPPSFLQGLR